MGRAPTVERAKGASRSQSSVWASRAEAKLGPEGKSSQTAVPSVGSELLDLCRRGGGHVLSSPVGRRERRFFGVAPRVGRRLSPRFGQRADGERRRNHPQGKNVDHRKNAKLISRGTMPPIAHRPTRPRRWKRGYTGPAELSMSALGSRNAGAWAPGSGRPVRPPPWLPCF